MSGVAVRSELVATVWKVLAAVGDEVAEGAILMMLESMKMEIPVIAQDAGLVVSIAVAEGEVVAQGQVLAEIEEAR